MKTLNKTVLVFAAIAALASCDRKYDYEMKTFASFYNSSASISETVGTYSIPVTLYNPTSSESKITVKIVSGSAVDGTDISLAEPATGVLTFAPGETQKDIVLSVVNNDAYTGNLNCTITLSPAVEGVGVGSLSSYSITILDKDHPLVAAGVAATYTVNQTGLYNSNGTTRDYTYTMELTTDPDDITKIWCDAFCYMAKAYGSNGNFSIYGIVSDDYLTITFPQGQALGFSTGNGTMYFYGGFSNWNTAHTTQGYYLYDGDYVEFKRASADSDVWECTDGLGVLDNYVWPTYGGFILGEADGYKTTWTKVKE